MTGSVIKTQTSINSNFFPEPFPHITQKPIIIRLACIRIRKNKSLREVVFNSIRNIAAHEIELAWSYIIDYENSFNPFDEKQSAINDLKAFVTIDTEETAGILKNAGAIQKIGLKVFDSLHVACAMETGCDYFLTTDDSMLKKLSGFAKIKVISPIELIRILEEK